MGYKARDMALDLIRAADSVSSNQASISWSVATSSSSNCEIFAYAKSRAREFHQA